MGCKMSLVRIQTPVFRLPATVLGAVVAFPERTDALANAAEASSMPPAPDLTQMPAVARRYTSRFLT